MRYKMFKTETGTRVMDKESSKINPFQSDSDES